LPIFTGERGSNKNGRSDKQSARHGKRKWPGSHLTRR